MPLSDEEQRMLAQLEASLAADDPHLARTMRGANAPRKIRHHVALACVLAFVLGLAGLVAGVEVHPVIGVLGFLLMLGSVVVGRDSVEPAQRPSNVRMEAGRRRTHERPS